jgi:hypothetical protein
MARSYLIFKSFGGTDLQVTGDGEDRNFSLNAVSDTGLLREAEEIVNREFYQRAVFSGFHWQPMRDGWSTTDHDLR